MKKKVIVFGAGERGKEFIQMTKHELEVLAVLDNDEKKWGGMIENISIEPVNYLCKVDGILVVIAVDNYKPIVLQLEEMGMKNYTLWSLLYQNNLQCKSRDIMNKWIDNAEVKNAWMNHLISTYREYDKKYFIDSGSCLDVGCGCCKELFYRLCKGYDAWGIDCCEWKKEYFE